MSDLSWNIWGAVAAALGFLVPALGSWIKSLYLTSKLKTLKKLIDETQEQLTLARWEGLLVDPVEYAHMHGKLWHARERMEAAGAQIHARSSGMISNLKGICSLALSSQVNLNIKEVNQVRVQLLKRSSQERKKLASTRSLMDLPNRADYQESLKSGVDDDVDSSSLDE
ncbi:hypothetical protein C8Q77DRAFT_1161185 [Trametes polyzona]|nr:hypothetical protein C8Q77DRAFT_1161185 [Trametes polyzona]